MRQRELGLPEMRLVATGVLVVLVLVYLSTFMAPSPDWPLKLLRAAAGAGIVGALADWFAVVALFRHPLGLPIPHTALLPRNQQRVAVNVGRFIEENFLRSDLIYAKLQSSQISKRVADWFLQDNHADMLVRRLLNGLARALRADMNEDMIRGLSNLIRKLVNEAATSPNVSHEISQLLQSGLKGPTLTNVVVFLRKTVDENRDAVGRLVRDNSRWWIASRVDRNASELIVTGVLSVLDDLAKPESALRIDFEQAAGHILRDFEEEDHLRKILAEAVDGVVADDAFDDKMRTLIWSLRNRLADHLESDEAFEAIRASLQETAKSLADDQDMQQRADDAIARFADSLLPEVRPYVSSFITQTIADWDPDLLVERFENEAGKDLQFIRINGALLGFAIGGVLFSVEHLFS